MVSPGRCKIFLFAKQCFRHIQHPQYSLGGGIVLCCALTLLFSACATKELRIEEHVVAADVPDPATPPEEFYRIGPGDLLDVVIWKEKDMSGPVAVRPDGYITLPLVNEVQAVGLSTAELREILSEKYTEFVNNPFVTVRVTKIASSEIFLIGEVVRPSAYPALGNDSLLQRVHSPSVRPESVLLQAASSH